MKAVILAAGFGTRMQKEYPNIPKVMLPINGRPLLEHTIYHLKKYGFDELFINLHYLPWKIKDYFGTGEKLGVKINYVLEDVILGTAGALHNFKSYLDSTFAVVYGDVFTTLDFDKMVLFHKDKKSDCTLLIHYTTHPNDSDLVVLNENEQIEKFYIYPHNGVINTNLSSAAIYLLEPKTLDFLPEFTPSDCVRDFFPILLKNKFKLFGYLSGELVMDIGTPERYLQLKKELET